MTIEARLKIAVIVAIAAIDAVWASVAGIRFDWPGALQLLVACPVLALVWAYYALKRGEAGLATMARETLFLLSFSGATALLSYLVTTLNRPLIDETLVAVDAAIGFDWMAYIAFINAHPLLGDLSTGFYLSSLPLIALAIAVLPLIGKADRAAELLTTVMVGALIAIAISGILPASGRWPTTSRRRTSICRTVRSSISTTSRPSSTCGPVRRCSSRWPSRRASSRSRPITWRSARS
ncbi:MAG: phosphatase PAP2 family protein [Hyphomicrobiales bacterium]